MNKKKLSLTIILMLIVSSFAIGQRVVQLIPYDGTASSYIIAQIRADTTANPGTLTPNTVYELTNGGIYLSTEILTLNGNSKTLRLRAPNGTKPIIYLYPTGTGANPQRPPGNFVVLNGANIEFTNIAIAGIFEPTPAEINNVQGGLINTTGVGCRIIINNCLLTNINGQHIRTGSGSKIVKVTNSIFANMGSLSTSNFGAGKGMDLREVSCDSLVLVNNTFVNYQDRVVRHLNLASGNTVTGILGYCRIDHNTFVNGMGFHGLLSLGNVGKKVQITNNLFVDAYALGADSLDVTRSVEYNNTGEKYPNGNNRMPWVFTAPNDTTVWDVKKNYFSISNDGQNWFNTHLRHFQDDILTDHIKNRLGADAATAFTKLNSFTLVKTPKLMTKLMDYYVSPTGGNYKKDKPGYSYLVNDMDRRTYKYYTDTLNCTYSVQSPAFTGAVGNYPAGDLNWFPTQKTDWEAGIGLGIERNNDIIPTEYTLDQNYPNPFNPATKIVYSIPKESNVRLEVFDILGKRVALLVNETQQVGQYKVDFDASKLSSGMYIYRLSSQGLVFSKKMML